MAAGKGGTGEVRHSPIVQAIGEAEAGTTGEIHVRLSKRLFERDPLQRAQNLFRKLDLGRTQHRNAVLIYVNLRRRKFAVLGDEGMHKAVGPLYWNELARELKQALLSTHPEVAIAHAVRHVGEVMRKHFPDLD